MRYNHTFLLFFVVLVQYSSLRSIRDEPATHNIIQLSPQDLPEDSKSSRLDAVMQVSFPHRPMSTREWKTRAQQVISYDVFCRETFHMGSIELNNVMQLRYDDLVERLFRNPKTSDATIRALVEEYLDRWGIFTISSRVDEFKKNIEKKITQRNQDDKDKKQAEQEVLEWHNKTIALQLEVAKIKSEEQRLINGQKVCEKHAQQEEQTRFEHALLEQEAQDQQEALIFYEQMIKSQYQPCDFDIADCPERELEPQWCERQEALQKTIEQDYKQYDQAFNLTSQTAGFLAAYDIDYHDFQGFFGTALQQQLHGEMCDVLSQAATLHMQFPYQSNLRASVVDFADAAYETNKNEQILLTSQLMDVDWIVLKLSREIAAITLPYAQAIVSGAAHGAIDSLVMFADPIGTFKGLGKAIYYVVETTALNSSEMVLEYPEIYEPMRDKRNAEITLALQNLGNQMAHSTGPERVEVLTRFGTGFVMPGKIIHAVGGVCGVIRSQAKIMRTPEGIAPMLADELGFEKATQELILATEKLEGAAHENVAKSVTKELMEAEKNFEMVTKAVSGHGAEIIKQSKATPPRSWADKKASALRKAERLVDRRRDLPDGRIRYYEKEKFSDTPGPTRGRSFVTEFDQKNGNVRQWNECYDHAGNVNRVRPTTINGRDVLSQHYPATYADIQNNIKGSKWRIPEKNVD